MKTPQEIKEWLLNNCVDSEGDLDISDLDFSDFDGNIFRGKWKVKKNMFQTMNKVSGNLSQGKNIVYGSLFQSESKAYESLFSYNNETRGKSDIEECRIMTRYFTDINFEHYSRDGLIAIIKDLDMKVKEMEICNE